MEKLIIDYPVIAVGIIGALAGLLVMIFKLMLKNYEKRIEMIEVEVDHQRTNYTTKFKEVNNRIETGNKELHEKIDAGNKELNEKIETSNRIILDAISTMKLDIQHVVDSVDKQVSICKTIQKLKDK